MKQAAITLDLDGVRHYHAIHGLDADAADDPPLTVGVERFLELCDDVGVRATLFVVGADLADQGYAARIAGAAARGHEVASHSYAHRYDLATAAPAEIEADLSRSREAIARAVGRAPVGFRAPGYNVSAALFSALAKTGFAYDSSVMFSPQYFVARALAIEAKSLFGRRSRSFRGDARQFFLPVAPAGVRELPITSLLGWPWIGTSLAFAPRRVAQVSARFASLSSPCVLELHAIDLCDADDGFHPALVRLRPDLRIPWRKKRDRFRAAMHVLAPHARCAAALAAERM